MGPTGATGPIGATGPTGLPGDPPDFGVARVTHGNVTVHFANGRAVAVVSGTLTSVSTRCIDEASLPALPVTGGSDTQALLAAGAAAVGAGVFLRKVRRPATK